MNSSSDFALSNGIRFEVKYDKPIEVLSYTESLSGLANLFTRFAQRTPSKGTTRDQPALYISTVEKGSIITYLIDTVSDVNGLFEFVTYLVVVYQWVRRGGIGNSERPDKKVLRELRKLVTVARKGGGNEVKITINYHENSPTIAIGHRDALEIDDFLAKQLTQNRVVKPFSARDFEKNETLSRAAESNASELAQEVARRLLPQRNEVVFRWLRVKLPDGALAFRGLIKSIDQHEREVTFATDEIEQEMFDDVNYNPFRTSFIVDAVIKFENGQSRYHILNVHEVVPDKRRRGRPPRIPPQ